LLHFPKNFKNLQAKRQPDEALTRILDVWYQRQ